MMGAYLETGLPEPGKPQELLAPNVGAAGSATDKYFDSARGFEGIPYYGANNRLVLATYVPEGIEAHLDVGTGAGAAIHTLEELGKYREPYRVIGIDLNRKDIIKARARFPDRPGATYIFYEGRAEDLRAIPTGTIDVVTALNTWHLFNLAEFLEEANRVLKEDGRVVANSGYAQNHMYAPDKSMRQWGLMLGYAQRDLKEQGFVPGEAVMPNLYSDAQIEEAAYKARFRKVTISGVEILMPLDEAQDTVSVEEFLIGAVPGVPVEKGRQAFRAAVPRVLQVTKTDAIRRGWLTAVLEK